MSVSVSILNLYPPWNESTLNVISCLGNQYVAKSALAKALDVDASTMVHAMERNELGHLLVDLTQLKDANGEPIDFPTRIQSGIELKNVPKIIKVIKGYTLQQKTDLIKFLKIKTYIEAPPIKKREEKEDEANLPQKKRKSPHHPTPPACQCANLMLDRLVKLEESIIANSQLAGQVLYKNSDKFKEDLIRWEQEERVSLRSKLEKEELVPFIKAKKEELNKMMTESAERSLEPLRAQKLAELEKEMEALRVKRMNQLKNDSVGMVNELNRFLLNK